MMRFTLLLLLLPLLAHSQNVNIEDFRLPESLFERLSGRFSADLSTSVDEGSSPFARTGKTSSAGGILGGDYYLLRSGEFLVIEWRPSLVGSFSISNGERRDTIATYRDDSRYERLSVQSTGQVSWYGSQDVWYVFGSHVFSGEYAHSRFSRGMNDSANVDVSKSLGYDANIGIGVGLGKMREGGSVAAALRILERMREQGLLLREPSEAEILTIAQLHSQERGYSIVYERSFKHFFGDLFRKLHELGILETTKFDAYALLYITDVRLERMYPRLFGWRIQAGFEHASYRTKRVNQYEDTLRRGGLDFITVMTEFGRALSLQTHFVARFGAKWITSERPKTRIDLQGSATVSHEAGEHLDAAITASFHRSHGLNSSVQVIQAYRSRGVDYGVVGDLGVYVENSIRIGLRIQYSTYDVQREYFYPEAYTSTRFSGSLSLEYRFF